jgi:hypothetical protein
VGSYSGAVGKGMKLLEFKYFSANSAGNGGVALFDSFGKDLNALEDVASAVKVARRAEICAAKAVFSTFIRATTASRAAWPSNSLLAS